MTLELCVLSESTALFDELSAALRGAVCHVERVSLARTALRRARCGCASLLLIDEDPPDMSAVELLRRIRCSERCAEALVVLLTPACAEIERVIAFELGADDYVLKPIGSRELGLRLRAVLRRHSSRREAAAGPLLRGPLEIEPDTETVRCSGEPVHLTPVEFRLLEHLARKPGKLQARADLLEKVWRWCDDGCARSVGSRTVDTHIKRLREKLGSASELIETIRGAGYRMRAAP